MSDVIQYKNIIPDWILSSNLLDDPDVIEIGSNEILFEQDDSPDAMYVVLAGALSVLRIEADDKRLELDRLYSADLVGEMGVINGQPRTATVQAIVPTRLLRITADQYAQVQAENTTLGVQIIDTTVERWERVQLSSILANLFGELDAGTVVDLQSRFLWKHLEAGELLCRRDDPAESMFILVGGRLRFEVTDEDGERSIIGEAGPGETVGEFALISTGTRSADVLATRATTVVEITRTLFNQLIQEYPQIMPAITRIIVERQQRAVGHLKSHHIKPQLAMTVLPLGSEVETDRFVDQLVDAMGIYGRVRSVRARDIDSAMGRDGAAQARRNDPVYSSVTHWLSEQEGRFDYLIYQPDPTWTAWSQRCAGQSDRVILLAAPDRVDPTPTGELERNINALKHTPSQLLVLWHPPETAQPTKTIEWLEPRPHIEQHFHVRDQDQAHFQRLARTLTGNAIGIVFSGGGARGYVQLGVLQALYELDIPLDFVGGSSFGSLIAFAPLIDQTGLDWLYPYLQKFSNPKYTQDRTIPLVALNKSAGLVEILKELCGDLQIEDAWLPYFATATNLSMAKSEIISRGPLWLAARKSIAIPGVYSPIVEDGCVLVDGGIMNNFPIDIMAERSGSRRIVAISVTPLEGKKRNYQIGHSQSGWRLLWQRINPLSRAPRVPTLAYTLLRSMEVNSVNMSRQMIDQADLFMVINPKQYAFLDFAKYKEIQEIGYRSSFGKLKMWKREQEDLTGFDSA